MTPAFATHYNYLTERIFPSILWTMSASSSCCEILFLMINSRRNWALRENEKVWTDMSVFFYSLAVENVNEKSVQRASWCLLYFNGLFNINKRRMPFSIKVLMLSNIHYVNIYKYNYQFYTLYAKSVCLKHSYKLK